MASASSMVSVQIIRKYVTNLQLQQNSAVCAFSNQTRVLLSRVLAKHLAVGTETTFWVPTGTQIGQKSSSLRKPPPARAVVGTVSRAAVGTAYFVFERGFPNSFLLSCAASKA
jgi:hypothetical protein